MSFSDANILSWSWWWIAQ